MNYCKFENTTKDLADVVEQIRNNGLQHEIDEAGQRERPYILSLLEKAYELIDLVEGAVGGEDPDDTLEAVERMLNGEKMDEEENENEVKVYQVYCDMADFLYSVYEYQGKGDVKEELGEWKDEAKDFDEAMAVVNRLRGESAVRVYDLNDGSEYTEVELDQLED